MSGTKDQVHTQRFNLTAVLQSMPMHININGIQGGLDSIHLWPDRDAAQIALLTPPAGSATPSPITKLLSLAVDMQLKT